MTSIAAASKTSSFWVTKELTSVLAPGIVLLCELGLLIRPLLKENIKAPLGTDQPGVFIILVLVVAIAWLLGYMSREAGFKILSFTEPRAVAPRPDSPPRSPRLQRWLTGLRCPHESPSQIRARLATYSSEPQVETLLRVDLMIKHLLESNGTFNSRVGGGNMPDDAAAALFSYCKLWLRRYSPELGLDSTELEINIVVSALLPAAVLPLVAAQTVGTHRGFWICTVSLIVLWMLVQVARAYRRLRGAERWEAIRNVLIAQVLWRSSPESSSPVARMATPSPAYDASARGKPHG